MNLADNVFDDNFYDIDNPTEDTCNELEDRTDKVKDSIIMIMNESFWDGDKFVEKKDFLSDLDDEYIGRLTIETKTPEFAFSIGKELDKIFIK